MTQTNTSAQALYAELDRATPGWRTAGHLSFKEAVRAAGETAQKLDAEWRAGFKSRVKQAVTRADVARKPKIEEDDRPVFDHGRVGHHVGAERRDAPGRELSTGDEEGEVRGAAIGRNEDSLYYPDGRKLASSGSPATDEPRYHWNPIPPRSYGTVRGGA